MLPNGSTWPASLLTATAAALKPKFFTWIAPNAAYTPDARNGLLKVYRQLLKASGNDILSGVRLIKDMLQALTDNTQLPLEAQEREELRAAWVRHSCLHIYTTHAGRIAVCSVHGPDKEGSHAHVWVDPLGPKAAVRALIPIRMDG